MKRFLLVSICCFGALLSIAQPTFTTDPSFPKADEPLTLTVDVSNTSLSGYSNDVWIWTWVAQGCSSNCDAPTNVDPATSAQDAAKMTRDSSDPDVYTITFTPTTFFEKPASELIRIGFKLKSVRWSDNIQTDVDVFIDLFEDELEVAFQTPATAYLFVDNGEEITIEANASENADITLTIGGTEVATTTGTSISYTHTVSETGSTQVEVSASTGGSTVTDEFFFTLRSATVTAALPEDLVPGINYVSGDESRVYLVLEAPNKNSAYVIGEFNNWIATDNSKMKRDGDLFWIEVTQLLSGASYGFQYIVDESIIIPDPYADLILDPDNDPFISSETYPNLKAYPNQANGLVSVLQTGQTPYNWQVNDFQAPPEQELVIYELLVRDFDDKHSYQGILDRMDYLESLGINAIQLMPIMEFDGNLSWGYNPSFFFAPDKYYGSKNELKRFIDECHARGVAVILDMVLNHTHEDSPLAQLYWDQANYRPAADNPWLNQEARHPFNVFFDFNHESSYTQDYVDRVNDYWLEEYRFDGYRFDLTKGFTQDFTGSSNVGAWSAKNDTRIALLKRMTDEIWTKHPNAYVIFEHLADNAEEKELADYGIMLWGNMNFNFNELTMGYGESIDWAYHGTRNWNDPNLIAYMESHDEERLQYKNVQFGASSGSYDVTDPSTGMERIAAASVVYYSIPGPKMIWQFGELAYDYSINWCTDGSINNDCRTGDKPIPWASSSSGLTYDQEANRVALKNITSQIIDLKLTYDIFNTSDFTLDDSNSDVKQMILKGQPYVENPSSADEMNVVTVANFDVDDQSVNVSFPHGGTWYSYFENGAELSVSGTSSSISMEPGDYKLYTDVRLATVTSTDFASTMNEISIVYPNPNTGRFQLKNTSLNEQQAISIHNLQGSSIDFQVSGDVIMLPENTPTGVYFVQVKSNNEQPKTYRLIKK